ncbi:MAG: 30S ribosomal protein S1, partial [Chloroflexota bacterium]|nr:30S ribosomal protein S1 [Chloroflexota bacterium]
PEPNFVEQHGPAAEQELSMEQLLASSSAEYKTLRRNEVLDGTIMSLDRDGLIVDVGSKSEGVVPASEMSTVNAEERETLIEGAPVLVSVVDANDNNDGHIVLSIDRARAERSWRDLQKQLDSGEVVEAPVVGHNKGGLLVELGGVRGFVPASQVSNLTGGSEEQRQTELAGYNGRAISMKVIEVNRRRNRLILSERQATQERRESRKEKLLEELGEGQVIEGTVTSLADFGAFVDIGGADGLIHLSELSWSRVNHPRDVLKPGDKLEVMVLNVDREHRKIALSSKRTQPEPWSTALDRYELGQMVSGTVTQVAPFGAFVRLEDGIEGLVHVSELSDTQVSSPSAVVKEGDVLQLKVIRIDTQRKRIGLSLRQAMDELGLDQYTDAQAATTEETAVPETPSDSAVVSEEADTALSQPAGSTEMARAFEAAQSVADASADVSESTANGETASQPEADQTTDEPQAASVDDDTVAPDTGVETTGPEENLSTQ